MMICQHEGCLESATCGIIVDMQNKRLCLKHLVETDNETRRVTRNDNSTRTEGQTKERQRA
jgi:hypothetical protein